MRNKPGHSFEYHGHRAPGSGWNNPAIAEILVGRKMHNTVQRVGIKAAGLWNARAPRRTGALASSASVTMQKATSAGTGPGTSWRWMAIVEAGGKTVDYAAAVEFGRRDWRGFAQKDRARNLTKSGTVRKRKPGRSKAAHTWRDIIRTLEAS